MIKFFSGAIRGGDNQASTARLMIWVLLGCAIYFWFNNELSRDHIVDLMKYLLIYLFGGKALFAAKDVTEELLGKEKDNGSV